MAVHTTKGIITGRKAAARFRKMGFDSTVYKTKKGVRVSVTRNIKK